MELETQTQLALNQLKRQTSLVDSLNGDLEMKNKHIKEQQVNTCYCPGGGIIDDVRTKLMSVRGN